MHIRYKFWYFVLRLTTRIDVWVCKRLGREYTIEVGREVAYYYQSVFPYKLNSFLIRQVFNCSPYSMSSSQAIEDIVFKGAAKEEE